MKRANDTELDKKWIDMLVASTIGPNIALYALADPEGEKRVEAVHSAIHITLQDAWTTLNEADDDINHEAFTETSLRIVLSIYNDYIANRLEWCLINGMPTKNMIVKPN